MFNFSAAFAHREEAHRASGKRGGADDICALAGLESDTRGCGRTETTQAKIDLAQGAIEENQARFHHRMLELALDELDEVRRARPEGYSGHSPAGRAYRPFRASLVRDGPGGGVLAGAGSTTGSGRSRRAAP